MTPATPAPTAPAPADALRIVQADFPLSFAPERQPVPEDTYSLVYMPVGTHEISATVDGAAATVLVTADAATAAHLDTILQGAIRSGGPRPYVGFDHRRGPAAFRPLRFAYTEADGIHLIGKLTTAGRASIDGHEYSHFSPTFFIDPAGRVVGIPPAGEIGSLTNNPAYRTLPPLMPTKTTTAPTVATVAASTPDAQPAAPAPATAAPAAPAPSTVAASAADAPTPAAAPAATEARIAALEADLRAARADLHAARADGARHLVQAAVDGGRIAPADAPRWVEAISADPAAATLLATIRPNADARTAPIHVAASATSPGPGTSRPSLTRAEFERLPHTARNAHMAAGGTIAT